MFQMVQEELMQCTWSHLTKSGKHGPMHGSTASESGGAAKAFRWALKETQYALQYVEKTCAAIMNFYKWQ